jgi:hypothetical protein
METTLYYTFSTIAQTLGGAIGLLAAFLVYYLGQLDAALRGHLDFLFHRYPLTQDTIDLESMWSKYDISGLLEYFDNDVLERLSGGDGTDRSFHLAPAKQLWASRREALGITRMAVFWTGGTIVGALVALASAHGLALGGPWLAVPVLAVGIGAAARCLWLYGRLILQVAKPQEAAVGQTQLL